MTHVAWSKIGLVKIGMTSRDPTKRAAEITSVSGLIAPCQIAWCCEVEDRRAVEAAVHAILASKRVHGRRELFRTDVATARTAIESVAGWRKPVTIARPRRLFRRRQRRLPWRSLAALALILLAMALLSH